MKTVCEEADTKECCEDHPKRLEHRHIERAFHTSTCYMNIATDNTPKHSL